MRFTDHKTPVLPRKIERTIQDLPTEVILRIFCELDLQGLHTCMLVSHAFNGLIQESGLLQYRIELWSNGMLDGPAGIPRFQSSKSRHKALLELQDSWFNLRPRKETRLESANQGTRYDFASGVLARGYASDDPEGARAWLRNLPSVLRDHEQSTIFHEEGISNNLLMLAEQLTEPDRGFCFKPRTLSGNAQHPQTNVEDFQYIIPHWLNLRPEHDIEDWKLAPLFQVSGRMVVLTITSSFGDQMEPNILVVFDWKTGELLGTYHSSSHAITSFLVVTPTLIVTSEYNPSYTRRHYNPHPRLLLLELQMDARGKSKLTHVQTLRFPSFQHSTIGHKALLVIIDFDITAGCGPLSPPQSPSCAYPFRPDPAASLAVVYLTLHLYKDREAALPPEHHSFHFLVPIGTILTARTIKMPSIPSSASIVDPLTSGMLLPPIAVRGLDWEEWGAKDNGACILSVDPEADLCASYGSRYAKLDSDGTGLVVIDFSPYVQAKVKDSDGEWVDEDRVLRKLVNTASMLSDAGREDCRKIFDADLGILSFAAMMTTVPVADWILMDAEHILFMRGDHVDVWTM
ncbi:hypothetical protein SISNIDRAFT_459853 [Sistotremastrum niveocremeum HHB9708]|uniref:F-box domain-containing protein n=1 Tax=Sistotremastrum niveocremeum HHB9708 TaxID=1314777 RepID=A0A164P5P1_9AGAM|nr:hypothetical protein SISNIDRAFT_459853 [Sistotremastrum niveocremeum HHB9708]